MRMSLPDESHQEVRREVLRRLFLCAFLVRSGMLPPLSLATAHILENLLKDIHFFSAVLIQPF